MRQHLTQHLSVPRLLALTLLLTLVPPLGTVEAIAIPRTTSTVIDGLPADPAGDPDVGVHADALDTHDHAQPEAISRQVSPDAPFTMVGFEVPSGVDAVEVRTSVDGVDWSEWYLSDVSDPDEAPDDDSAEAADPRARVHVTDPVWTGEAHHLQIRLAGADPEDVDVTLIDSLGLSGQDVTYRYVPTGASAEAQEATGTDVLKPDIITRDEWGAASYKGTPHSAHDIFMGVIHHTANPGNDYAEWEAPGLVRGMQRYHQDARGWSDIGYNILVDKYGNVYEGRAGGLENAIQGAHASGYNYGSFGVSVIGNHDQRWPTRATVDALIDVIAWQSAVYDIDPDGYTWSMGDGEKNRRILGHGDVGDTSCPGDFLRRHFEEIRTKAAAKSYPFRDVSTHSVHRWPIAHLWFAGIIEGCADGRYCAGDDATRGDTAFMIAGLLGLESSSAESSSDEPTSDEPTSDEPTSEESASDAQSADAQSSDEPRFWDVSPGSKHYDAINAVAGAGIISGYGDGSFRPGDPIIRSEVATILARAAGLDPDYSDHFTDVASDSPHRPWIYALAEIGVTHGCQSTRFCPTDLTSRGEMASFIDRMRQR